jgi:hypothetical protein
VWRDIPTASDISQREIGAVSLALETLFAAQDHGDLKRGFVEEEADIQ